MLHKKHCKSAVRDEESHLHGYTDADCAAQEHRHSISGYAFMMYSGVISWSAKKQSIIVLSRRKPSILLQRTQQRKLRGYVHFSRKSLTRSRHRLSYNATTNPQSH